MRHLAIFLLSLFWQLFRPHIILDVIFRVFMDLNILVLNFDDLDFDFLLFDLTILLGFKIILAYSIYEVILRGLIFYLSNFASIGGKLVELSAAIGVCLYLIDLTSLLVRLSDLFLSFVSHD